jgi:hypothetical protein
MGKQNYKVDSLLLNGQWSQPIMWRSKRSNYISPVKNMYASSCIYSWFVRCSYASSCIYSWFVKCSYASLWDTDKQYWWIRFILHTRDISTSVSMNVRLGEWYSQVMMILFFKYMFVKKLKKIRWSGFFFPYVLQKPNIEVYENGHVILDWLIIQVLTPNNFIYRSERTI